MRRAAVRRLDPGPDPDQAWEFFVSEPIQCAARLRELVGVDENMYLHTAGQAVGDARGYVIYTALDEVVKAALWLMRIRDFLQGDTSDPRSGVVERLLHAHIEEERNARIRRLLEVLTTLVNFVSTNDQAYYRYLLAAEILDEQLSSYQDLVEFWESPSSNIQRSIDGQIALILSIEREIDPSQAWFLGKDQRPVSERGKLRAGRLLSSARSRIIRAFPQMTNNERMLFGFSYGASYGTASDSIHYSPQQMNWRMSADDDLSRFPQIGLLAFSIIDRCHELLGRPNVPKVSRVLELLARSDSRAIFGQTTRRASIQVGDFVLAYGDLAQVTEVIDTKHGYQSFRVRYLAERPMPEIHEDVFPAMYIQPFYTREHFLAQAKHMGVEGKLPPDIIERMTQLPPEELAPILAASLTNVWKIGLGEWVRQEQARRAAEQRKRRKQRSEID
jgi:hypothetical protein